MLAAPLGRREARVAGKGGFAERSAEPLPFLVGAGVFLAVFGVSDAQLDVKFRRLCVSCLTF